LMGKTFAANGPGADRSKAEGGQKETLSAELAA